MGENVIGYRYINTLVQPCCTSRLLWRRGRVSDCHPGDPGSITVQVRSEDIFLHLSHMIRKYEGVHNYQDGCYAHIMVKCHPRNQLADFDETWHEASDTQAHHGLLKNNHCLTLTYFMARSNVTMLNSFEIIAACYIEVG